MAHQVLWNKILLERFIDLGSLTEIEERVMRTRAAGWTRIEQSLKLGVSVATIDRTISALKRKYDSIQKYDPILPPRDLYHNVLHPADDN